jgi:hypothetical protein
MPSDTTARVTQASVRRRSSSRERRQRTNYRIALVAYMLVWIAAGMAIEWPATAKCLERPQESRVLSSALAPAAEDGGVMETARRCLPEPALDLLLWTLAGAASGLVVYYLVRRQH